MVTFICADCIVSKMGSNRGRQFYRHDLVPSVDRRQHDVLHARNADNHSYLPRFIASDPMYNHIRWVDEYMAYFRLNFFTPNNSFSHRGEFSAVPREMVNTVNRPSLIKYPPSFRDMQGISYKRRQKIPKCIRTRTFWRQKNLNDKQYSEENLYEPGYQEDRESEDTNESADWRKNWRISCNDDTYSLETERCETKENSKFCISNLISSIVTDKELDTNRIKLDELHIGDSEEDKQDSISSEDIASSFIQEQTEIFELLKECDYRHQMLFNMGLNWFEGKYKPSDSDESDSDDNIQVIIKMPEKKSGNSEENQDKENINIGWRKRRFNFNLLNEPLNNLKRQKMSETDELKKRILEMKINRQILKEKFEQKIRRQKRASKSRKGEKVSSKLNMDNIFSCVITNSIYSAKIKDDEEETEQWRKSVESTNSFEAFSMSYSLNLEYSYKMSDDSKELKKIIKKKTDMELITSLPASSFCLDKITDFSEILDQVKYKDFFTCISKEFVSEMMDWFDSNVEKLFVVRQTPKPRMFRGYKLQLSQHQNAEPSVMKTDNSRVSIGDNLNVEVYQANSWPDLEISKDDLLMERLKRLDIAVTFASEMMKYVEDWRRNPVIYRKWHSISKLNRNSIEEKSEHSAGFLYAKLPELEFSSESSPEFDQIWKTTSNRITSTPSNSVEVKEFFNNNLDLSWELLSKTS